MNSSTSAHKVPPPRPIDVVEDRPTNPKVLLDVIDAALQAGPTGVVVFDLDSTLFMNFTRWVRILREFAEARNIPKLRECRPDQISGFSVYWSLVQAGLPEAQALELLDDVTAFWAARFYSSPYCIEDVPVEGARTFLLHLQQAGAQIAYCTGRHTEMYQGTVDCLQKYDMPVPDEKQVHLLVKPTFAMSDDEWKQIAYKDLSALGQVLSIFDNEPAHINGYHEAFPQALAVHVLTNDSGRGIRVHPGIPSVRDFVLPAR